GRLEDGPNGEILSLRYEGTSVQTLRAENTHSGDTVIDAGTIELSHNGTLQESEVKVSGTLVLNNSETALSSRLSNEKGVTISGGNLQLTGNPVTPITENISA